MILVDIPELTKWECIPRESGDDPDGPVLPGRGGMYSPRERG